MLILAVTWRHCVASDYTGASVNKVPSITENEDTAPQPLAYPVPVFTKKLSLSESFGWKMISDGRLKAIKIGRRTLIPHSELVRFMQGGAQ